MIAWDCLKGATLAASSDLNRIGMETGAKACHWGAGRRRAVCMERDRGWRDVNNAFETLIRRGNGPIDFSEAPSARVRRNIAFSIVITGRGACVEDVQGWKQETKQLMIRSRARKKRATLKQSKTKKRVYLTIVRNPGQEYDANYHWRRHPKDRHVIGATREPGIKTLNSYDSSGLHL